MNYRIDNNHSRFKCCISIYFPRKKVVVFWLSFAKSLDSALSKVIPLKSSFNDSYWYNMILKDGMRRPRYRAVKSAVFNHSIISPLCLVWIRAPLWPHMRQAKFCLRVCQVVFLGVLPFSSHLLIGPSHMS